MQQAPSSLARRLGWLLLFWAAGVLALGALALCLRLLMRLAGLGA
jgi:hypothetical protein